jgi:hypothetical protein
MFPHQDFKHVGESATLCVCALLPEVSDLRRHLERSRFCFGFGAGHISTLNAFIYISLLDIRYHNELQMPDDYLGSMFFRKSTREGMLARGLSCLPISK